MIDLMPKFCPHCHAHFVNEMVEIKTSNPPKCGRCLLPLWWEDRSGKTPDKPWPSYEHYLALLADFRQMVEDLEKLVKSLEGL